METPSAEVPILDLKEVVAARQEVEGRQQGHRRRRRFGSRRHNSTFIRPESTLHAFPYSVVFFKRTTYDLLLLWLKPVERPEIQVEEGQSR